MSGILFKYFDGYLRVVFHPVDHGMVPFDLVLHGDVTARAPVDDQWRQGEPMIHGQDDVTIRMWISSVLGGFGCLVSWLEAVTCGVQECSCYWDGEGPDGELRWGGSWKSGMLKVTWTADDQEHRVRLHKAQMVRAFYESFRSYVQSARYNPLAYEQLTVGETFALVLDGTDLDSLADHLATLPGAAAEALIEELQDFAYYHGKEALHRASLSSFVDRASRREAVSPGEERWIRAEWQTWDPAQRRCHIVENIYPRRSGIEFGEKLRELRSPIIEQWLTVHRDSCGQSGAP